MAILRPTAPRGIMCALCHGIYLEKAGLMVWSQAFQGGPRPFAQVDPVRGQSNEPGLSRTRPIENDELGPINHQGKPASIKGGQRWRTRGVRSKPTSKKLKVP